MLLGIFLRTLFKNFTIAKQKIFYCENEIKSSEARRNKAEKKYITSKALESLMVRYLF